MEEAPKGSNVPLEDVGMEVLEKEMQNMEDEIKKLHCDYLFACLEIYNLNNIRNQLQSIAEQVILEDVKAMEDFIEIEDTIESEMEEESSESVRTDSDFSAIEDTGSDNERIQAVRRPTTRQSSSSAVNTRQGIMTRSRAKNTPEEVKPVDIGDAEIFRSFVKKMSEGKDQPSVDTSSETPSVTMPIIPSATPLLENNPTIGQIPRSLLESINSAPRPKTAYKNLSYMIPPICPNSDATNRGTKELDTQNPKPESQSTAPSTSTAAPPTGALPTHLPISQPGGQPGIKSGIQPVVQAGMQSGAPAGMQPGMQAGMQPGMQASMQAGMQASMQASMQAGVQAGMQPGMQAGMQAGVQPGVQPGMQPGMQTLPSSTMRSANSTPLSRPVAETAQVHGQSNPYLSNMGLYPSQTPLYTQPNQQMPVRAQSSVPNQGTLFPSMKTTVKRPPVYPDARMYPQGYEYYAAPPPSINMMASPYTAPSRMMNNRGMPIMAGYYPATYGMEMTQMQYPQIYPQGYPIMSTGDMKGMPSKMTKVEGMNSVVMQTAAQQMQTMPPMGQGDMAGKPYIPSIVADKDGKIMPTF